MRRDLGFGIAWFGGLFAFDVLSSWSELRSALGRVEAEEDVMWVARREIAIYVVQALGTYLLMGLVAGLVLALLNRALPGGSAWLRRWLFAAGVTLWILLRGAILWPAMHHGVPGRDWIAGNVEPTWMSAGFGLVLALGILLEARRGLKPAWLLAFLASLGLISMADHQPAAPAPKKNQGTNVIVFGIDSLRPDHLAHFGYARETAPALERALDRMAVFEHAFTPEARTWEAWSSILTGVYPATHGKRWSLPAPGDELPDAPMITHALQRAGYHTRFLTDDSRFSYMLPVHGFDVIEQPPVGFRAFAASRHQPNFRTFFTFLNGPLGWNLMPAYRHNQAYGISFRPDAFAEYTARQVAEAAEHDRFFLAIHVCPLHTPADRPWPYHRMYGMADYRGGNRYRYRSYGSALVDDARLDSARLEALERRSRQQNQDLYDSGIAMVDLVWRRMSEALDQAGLWENTLVIVLSDHGEDFLEEGARYRFRGPNHGFHPWGTGQQRVLLAMAGPGVEPGRREELTSLIDVAPTIAAAAGLTFDSSEGVPLQEAVPDRVLLGETGVGEPGYWPAGHLSVPFKNAQKRYTLDPETGRAYQRPEYDEITIAAKDRWAFDAEFWLVQEPWEDGGHRYSLFRWREDPVFRSNVLPLYPEVARRLAAALREKPRFPGRPEVVEDPIERLRPHDAEQARAAPMADTREPATTSTSSSATP